MSESAALTLVLIGGCVAFAALGVCIYFDYKRARRYEVRHDEFLDLLRGKPADRPAEREMFDVLKETFTAMAEHARSRNT